MRIGNGLSIAIVASFALWAVAGLMLGRVSLVDIGWAVACAATVFAVGAVLFAVSAIGGGDVKLLAAASLFAGPAMQLDFLTVTALTGGMLGLAILLGAPIGPKPMVPAEGEAIGQRLRRGLPYGPAIAAGGLWVASALVIS
jgi:prepilin peptidase CpaA